ncbi:MAG: patatin-like phospholipase family protein [Limisphaerales bacterium]
MKPAPPSATALSLVAAIVLTGCAWGPKRSPVPEQLTGQAQVPGLPGVRVILDPFAVDVLRIEASLAEAAALARDRTGPMTVLAISGGGSHGAFGAGLLNGWTETGTRPEFDIVAGISTGALIAPFAFLGPDFDDELKTGYTTITDKDIYRKRDIFGLLNRWDSAMDTGPLLKTLYRSFDEPVLARIAAEHRRGRRLYVGTTDLDAQALVSWDMGAIAASGQPGARDLFCRVLLASASIPGAFPPVEIEVEADGRRYREMHADGGCLTQVFGMGLLGKLMSMSGRSEGRMYVLRNSQFTREWEVTKRTLPALAGRAISTLIKSNGLGDIYRSYVVSLADGVELNMTSIPATFVAGETKGMFDMAFMNRLYQEGYELARTGKAWEHLPPGVQAMMESRPRPAANQD